MVGFEPQLYLFGKLFLAALLGMLVGTERVAAGKSAGSRTFALVSLGACLFVILGQEVNAAFLGAVNFDPMRVAAATIMGIGFLGGGLIYLQDKSLRGLTTAAGIWVAAGIGMAVGFGFFSLSIFASSLTLFIFTFMWIIEDWLRNFFERMQGGTARVRHADLCDCAECAKAEMRMG
ncbi:MAG: MgtC/SapB family protein [Parcubacteria group bacterium]|nr:MgtC/SapB family protein [Parcubacteria group bacterium]